MDDDDPLDDQMMQTVFDPLNSGVQVPREGFATQIDFSVLEADLYTPQRRIPHAKLMVIDDHCADEGEILRIRKKEFSIGRQGDDLAIESDFEMSAKHAILHCKLDDGRLRWRLTDVGSTNGTFVRIARAPLNHGREMILGLQRYRVEIGEVDDPLSRVLNTPLRPTPRVDQRGGGGSIDPPLRLVNTADASQVYPAISARSMIGSNPKRCSIAIEDRCLSAEHARLVNKRGKWQIEDNGSLNGIWVRVTSVWLNRHAEFQLGEQRFRFSVDTPDAK